MDKFKNKKTALVLRVSSCKLQDKGAAVLPAVIIFGAVAFGLVVTGLFVTQLINRSVFGLRLAEEAAAAARSVVADVHLKLIRDDLLPPIACDDGNPVFTDYGTVALGRTTVSVGICRYNCGLNICRYRARAAATTIFMISRKLEAVFNENTASGQISLSELAPLKF